MTKQIPVQGCGDRNPVSPIHLNVLVVFDDFATGHTAHEALLSTERNLGDQKFNLRFWSFEQIQNASLGKIAAQEAAAADLVFFATAADGDLPPAIKLWIGLWEDHLEDGYFGLAVMLNNERSADEAPSPGYLYLNQVARRHGADFIHTAFPVSTNDPQTLDAPAQGESYVHCFRAPAPDRNEFPPASVNERGLNTQQSGSIL